MQGVFNPRVLLRVTWSHKWVLVKEYNVFLNYFIDGKGVWTLQVTIQTDETYCERVNLGSTFHFFIVCVLTPAGGLYGRRRENFNALLHLTLCLAPRGEVVNCF